MSNQMYHEFYGPNFEHNGYASAQYRCSLETTDLKNFIVPARLEALHRDGTWHQHPVAFLNYGSYEALKENDAIAVLFLADGKYTSWPNRPLTDEILFDEAEKKGLTQGFQSNLKVFIKEESL